MLGGALYSCPFLHFFVQLIDDPKGDVEDVDAGTYTTWGDTAQL